MFRSEDSIKMDLNEMSCDMWAEIKFQSLNFTIREMWNDTVY
jgi:hypothetical protein